MLDYAEDQKVIDLRSTLRELVDQHVPAGYLGAFTDDPGDLEIAQRFCRTLGDQRLFALTWPEEFGGGGGSSWEQTALREEMWAAHEPRGAQYMGLNWVGPVLMRHGTDDQQKRHLPQIAAGDVLWCQGFSEPDAGSDLPALRTRAVRDGEGWRIHGQKVWTSYAQMARWCFLLARTGPADSRKEGITIFLLDMQQPGVEVRPIKSMLGRHHINEVYFDGAFVPDADVLGEVNGAWPIVTDVIAFERIGIARYSRCDKLLSAAPAALGEAWEQLPASLRERWAKAMVYSRQTRLLAYKVVNAQDDGKLDPADAATYRIAVTLLDQQVAEVLMDMVGGWGLGTTDPQRIFERAVEDHWRYAQASTVASGTLEMQRIALARRMVGKK